MKDSESLPSYADYGSMVRKGIGSAIPAHAHPAIHDLIAAYCGGLTKDSLLASFLGKGGADAKDKLLVARRIAIWACLQTDSFLPLGRGNVLEDIIDSKGLSYAHAVQARRIVKQTNGGIYYDACVHYKDLMKVTNYNDDNPNLPKAMADLMIRSLQALNFKAGNCHEFASITTQCLAKARTVLGTDLPDGILNNISIIKTGNDDDAHVFIVLKVQTKEYSSELLYCDPWARFVGTLREAESFQLMGKTGDKVYTAPNLIIALPPRSFDLVTNQEVCYKERDVFALMYSIDHDAVFKFIAKTAPDDEILKQAAEVYRNALDKKPSSGIFSQPKEAAKLTPTATLEEISNDSDEGEDLSDIDDDKDNKADKTAIASKDKEPDTPQKPSNPSNSFT